MAAFEVLTAACVALPLIGTAFFGYRAKKANQRAKERIASRAESAADQLRRFDQRD